MNKIIMVFSLLLVVLFGLVVPVSAQQEQHCPDHTTAFKFEGAGTGEWQGVTFTVAGATVSFGANAEFCVKAANDNSDKISGISFMVNWENDGGEIPDISYIIIYQILETPTSTPTFTQEPTNTSTPTQEVTATQGSGATPTQTPTYEERFSSPPNPTPTPVDAPSGGGGDVQNMVLLFASILVLGGLITLASYKKIN